MAKPMPSAINSGRMRLTAALEYLSQGWALLPLLPSGKVPHADLLPKDIRGRPSWKLLALRPASDPEVRDWFAKEPNCNIGIICGPASGGLVIADLDAPPPASWERPITPCVRTSRGEHLYFRTQQNITCHNLITPRGCHVGEVKGEGGYVVAPPSLHESGRLYTWQACLSPDDLNWTFANAPAWISATPATLTSKPPQIASTASKEYSLLDTPCVLTEKRPLAEAIFRWLADQNAVIEALTRLGIPQRAIIEIGNGFCCVLPGHDERRPSAALYRGDNGLILYACWHGRSGTGPDWYFPAEVLASQAYGKAVKLNRPELAAWTLRQLVEIGFLAPAPVPYVDLPAGATQAVSKVYEGFRLLLGCKWLHTPGAPSAFSWRFASAWCDVTYRLAGDAIKYLLGSGHLLPAGKQTRRGRELTVFLPGTVRDVTIRKVKTVFPGAREIHAEDDN